MKMTIQWSFSCNSFVKLSFYDMIHVNIAWPIRRNESKNSAVKGLHCAWYTYCDPTVLWFLYEKICLQAFMILICTDQPAHLLSGQGMHSLGFEFCMFH